MLKRTFKLFLIFSLVSLLGASPRYGWAQKGHDQEAGKHAHEEADGHEHGAGDEHGHGPQRLRIGKQAQTSSGFRRAKVHARQISNYINATGRVELNADATAHIIPRIPGRIHRVLKHLGDRVKKGETLVIVDSLEMSRAKSHFLVAKSALALAESNFKREKRLYENKIHILEVIKKVSSVEEAVEALKDAELGEAKGKILTAMTDLELATDVFKREKGLVESGIGARKEFIKAQKNLVSLKIHFEAVLEEIRINAYRTFVKFQTKYISAKSEFSEAKERLYLYGLSEAEIAAINSVSGIKRALFPVTAPFAGTLVEKHVTLGEMVGDESLYTLSDLSRLWVLTDIYEKDLASIKTGQEVLVSVAAYSEQFFPGEIDYISDLMDERTRTVKVRVVVDNKRRLLKPGMFAQVMIKAKTVARGIAVPLSAVQSKDKENMVFVVVGEEEFEKRTVKLGRRDKEYAIVLEGLKEGEEVLTKGSFLLKSELAKTELPEGCH